MNDDLRITYFDRGIEKMNLPKRREVEDMILPTLAEIEQNVVLARLDYHKGNRTHTARSLKIGVRTLQRMLKDWGIVNEKRINQHR